MLLGIDEIEKLSFSDKNLRQCVIEAPLSTNIAALKTL